MTTIVQTRPVFCGVCARPTGEVMQPDQRAPVVPYCEDCVDLPVPWNVDYDAANQPFTRIREDRRLNTLTEVTPADAAAMQRRAAGHIRFVNEPPPIPAPPVRVGRPRCPACDGTEFRPRINATTRGWVTGWGPCVDTTETDYDDDEDATIFAEAYIDHTIDEDVDETYDEQIEYIECTNCAHRWDGPWEYA